MESLEMDVRPEGIVLMISASPGSRTNGVRGIQNGAVKISVTQVAERGKATKAILEELARFLNIRKSQVELLAGETARQKKVLLRGLDAETVRQAFLSLQEY